MTLRRQAKEDGAQCWISFQVFANAYPAPLRTFLDCKIPVVQKTGAHSTCSAMRAKYLGTIGL